MFKPISVPIFRTELYTSTDPDDLKTKLNTLLSRLGADRVVSIDFRIAPWEDGSGDGAVQYTEYCAFVVFRATRENKEPEEDG